jgi:hypothetical protein
LGFFEVRRLGEVDHPVVKAKEGGLQLTDDDVFIVAGIP